jgi:ParB family chromosome partitioning protein
MGVLPAMQMKENPGTGRLTRGLASLLSRTAAGPPDASAGEVRHEAEEAPPRPSRHGYVELPVSRIRANAYQPRRDFDAGALAELAASIRESGVLQPIVVRRTPGGFELVAGERRLRAAKEAGLETVPAIVRDCTEDEMLHLALVENLQRDDLNPMELARGYALLCRKFGLSQEEVASRLGVSRPSVANTLRLLELPESVREMVSGGVLTAGHARAVLSVEGGEARLALARVIVERGLSVRDAERRAQEMSAGPDRVEPALKGGAAGGRERPAHLRALEERLAERLGTKVEIVEGRRKGKIVVEFYSNDDFERIMEVMGAAA